MKQTDLHVPNRTGWQRTATAFFIFLLALLILNGCQKDASFFERTKENIIRRLKQNAEKEPFVVVHAGSSIQAAIDAALPCTVIKIEAGVYKEALVVTKKGIVLVGDDGSGKQEVVIENPGNSDNGISVTANDFVLKNITVRNFKENGIYLNRVDGFLVLHVKAVNNGEYGLFPVHCKNGLIERCFASGHTDTGIYVGQSTDVDLNWNTATANVNGFEIENSSNISAARNKGYNNTCGLLVSLLPKLDVKVAAVINITNSQFYDNNRKNSSDPADGFEALVPAGSGILIIGADKITLKDNLVTGNNFVGIATVSTLVLGSLAGLPPSAFADIEPNPDGIIIEKNTLKNNGSAPPQGLPLPGGDLLWDGSGKNNCWSKNNFTVSNPATLPSCN